LYFVFVLDFSRYFALKNLSIITKMTVLAVGTVATVLTAGAAAPVAAAATAATAGAATGAATAAGAAVATGAAGAAVATGAAVASGAAAATGAATAAGAAAATGAATGAASLGTVAGIVSGPVGWVILGTSKEEQSPSVYTFDCWKLVLHDDSREPSNGRLLRDVVQDSRIKQVTTTNSDCDLPNLVLQNVWDEEFRIEYVYLPDGQLTTHAVKILI
jgi:hypothetical protein